MQLKTDKEQSNTELLLKIAEKTEWSKLVYRDYRQPSIYCCPLCGGVRPDEYDRHGLQNDMSACRGHVSFCLYSNLKRGNGLDRIDS